MGEKQENEKQVQKMQVENPKKADEQQENEKQVQKMQEENPMKADEQQLNEDQENEKLSVTRCPVASGVDTRHMGGDEIVNLMTTFSSVMRNISPSRFDSLSKSQREKVKEAALDTLAAASSWVGALR